MELGCSKKPGTRFGQSFGTEEVESSVRSTPKVTQFLGLMHPMIVFFPCTYSPVYVYFDWHTEGLFAHPLCFLCF